MTTLAFTCPTDIEDKINCAILRVSEDQIQGFCPDPFAEIARMVNLPESLVVERIQAMLQAGTIRRVRQTLLATNLAQGALVAWKVPQDMLESGFDYLFQQDPFSGHVVIRSTDRETPGSAYRLWTTLKVPQGFSIQKHAEYLQEQIGAEKFLIMPAKRIFALGVGHLRRRDLVIGSKAEVPAEPLHTNIIELTGDEWKVLASLKRELTPAEVSPGLWERRANEEGISLELYLELAAGLVGKKVFGRFSTFLEHVKPTSKDLRVTRYNALFHWTVPAGREIEAGGQVGRFHILTHAYWREGGPEFNNVNIMAVAHGMDKELVLKHKASIDAHLADYGMPVSYTNVFWGGRSEIKPSEITPQAYLEFLDSRGLDQDAMR